MKHDLKICRKCCRFEEADVNHMNLYRTKDWKQLDQFRSLLRHVDTLSDDEKVFSCFHDWKSLGSGMISRFVSKEKYEKSENDLECEMKLEYLVLNQ